MKLQQIQAALKAPKNQYNSFGKFAYRSCEDIVEAVKPLLAEHNFALIMRDEIIMIGNRFYVLATVSITDGTEMFTAHACAREEETKKGMDGAMITGAASSYARKYALNGLFAIDDNRDSDQVTNGEKSSAEEAVTKATENRTSAIHVETEPGEVIVHLGRSTKGKKVKKLKLKQLDYFAREFEPKTEEDRILRAACALLLPKDAETKEPTT